ncbi:fimbrillin family protein [Bacteroides sp.]|uniref:fimbrillin family protein n=1 Tax=Bacteroides sp. TaxID=29523 RepID=UPI002FCC4510
MKKRLYTILIVVILIACTKEQEKVNRLDLIPILFVSSIESTPRASITDEAEQFSEGDKIGIMGYYTDLVGETINYSTPFINKEEFVFNSGKFTSASTNIYWQIGKIHSFYSYYPSSLAINTDKITSTLIVEPNKGIADDVMYAKSENTTAFTGAMGNIAQLDFYHALSKVRFQVRKETETNTASNLTKVEFTMTTNRGTFGITTGTIVHANDATEVSLHETMAQTVTTTTAVPVDASWLVLPNDKIKNIKFTINNRVLTANIKDGDITTAAGQITLITITIKPQGLEFSKSTLESWSNDIGEGEVGGNPDPIKIGDYYYTDNSYSSEYDKNRILLGLVYRVNVDGKTGLIMSVDEDTTSYSTNNNEKTGATDLNSGEKNHETIKKNITNSNGAISWNNYPAFKWCNDKNKNGITGWYLPAKNELQSLYTGLSGFRWVPIGTIPGEGEIVQWPDNVEMPDCYNYWNTRIMLNNKLTAPGIGGVGLSDFYWSSSEGAINYSWVLVFGNGFICTHGKISPYCIRCIKSF